MPRRRVKTGAAYAGVWSWITTVDHKRIGILYGATAFLFFLLGRHRGAAACASQLRAPDNTLRERRRRTTSCSRCTAPTMIFLAIMPLSADVLQLHDPAPDRRARRGVPRLNAFSYWVFLLRRPVPQRRASCSARRPTRGWFGYANLTSRQFSPGRNVDFWMLGLQILGIASLAAAVNFFVTIINMRAPGMTLHAHADVHLDDASSPRSCSLLAFPVITVALDPADVRPLLRDPLLRAGRRRRSAAAGSTCSGSSAIPRSTSSSCRPSASCRGPAGVLAQAAVRLRRRWSSRACSSRFLGFGVWSHHMFTDRAWARSPTRSSRSPRC